MSSPEQLVCTLCGRAGIIYMFETKPYCPPCLSKKRPPIPHAGPERRRIQTPTVYGRRESDFRKKRPFKG